AKSIGCGDATVVRFSRKLGLDGYQALKIAVASEVSSSTRMPEKITLKDSCFEIFTKRINDIESALELTRSVLSADELEKAAQAIMKAKRVVVFGLGNSASVANDAQHKFLRLGLNATACSDNHMQCIIASHLDENCVAIGISHSGLSEDIVEALKLAKLNGATTVCVTNYGESPLKNISDIKLFTKSDETKHTILAMSSRIAQLTIFDAIYTYIIANDYDSSVKAIKNTESALKDKKL
ncbi:MAG: MurR/RpiR family transcriptional regulator, partial [Clostridia bacterium]|nr:MurR/RpiR family transcriptional regulator [Clostridia bacterium]